MSWVATKLAHIDRLGRLFCIQCEPEVDGVPVYGDAHFTTDDKCDRCGKQLEHVPTNKYVHTSH